MRYEIITEGMYSDIIGSTDDLEEAIEIAQYEGINSTIVVDTETEEQVFKIIFNYDDTIEIKKNNIFTDLLKTLSFIF